MSECGFNKAWVGRCKNDSPCAEHAGKVCCSCGAPATRDCESTGQFICGALLCDDCEHTLHEDGTNGGVGFNERKLPNGMKSHCKKTEQIFTPRYARDGALT